VSGFHDRKCAARRCGGGEAGGHGERYDDAPAVDGRDPRGPQGGNEAAEQQLHGRGRRHEQATKHGSDRQRQEK
jgi:hypothetical protein